MKELILEKKKEAFDNAIKTYLEFKKTLPLLPNNKLDFENFSDVESALYEELLDKIWNTKFEYINDLNIQKDFNKEMTRHINDNDPLMDYNNKNLFVIHNKPNFDDYFIVRFTLVGIKEDNHIKLGLSICNEKDNFSRKIGRELAYNRAINNNWIIPLKLNDPLEIRNYLQELANDISENIDWYKINNI